jgi:hypothetical protein
MARRFLDTKNNSFYFVNETGQRMRYVLIFGDEVNTQWESYGPLLPLD